MPHKPKFHRAPQLPVSPSRPLRERGLDGYKLLNSRSWMDPKKGLRIRYLRLNPACSHCGRAATEVDHIKPHRGNADLFYDWDNLQSLCKPCHSRKTVMENGGFGRDCNG